MHEYLTPKSQVSKQKRKLGNKTRMTKFQTSYTHFFNLKLLKFTRKNKNSASIAAEEVSIFVTSIGGFSVRY
jgi:hypothetical protein